MKESKQKEKSPHILSASASLMGICFIVLTSLKILHLDKDTLLDEITAVAILFFMVSSIFSFLSIRSNKNEDKYERIADVVFMIGLFMLTVITIFLTFNFV